MEPVRLIGTDQMGEAEATAGMGRQEAARTEGMWTGLALTEPRARSAWHHHAEWETSAYVVEGALRVEFGPGGRDSVDAAVGEFVVIPKHAVHRESNPGDVPGTLVVTRAGAGEIVVNVDGPQEG